MTPEGEGDYDEMAHSKVVSCLAELYDEIRTYVCAFWDITDDPGLQRFNYMAFCRGTWKIVCSSESTDVVSRSIEKKSGQHKTAVCNAIST